MAKPLLPTPPDFPILGELEPHWVKHVHGAAERGTNLEALSENPQYQEILKKHGVNLLGGPSIGQLTPTSAVVWFRTAQPAEVMITHGEKSFGPVKTSYQSDLTGTIKLTGLNPFSKISYNLKVDGTAASPAPEKLAFRTPPEAGARERFSIAFGSCSRFVPDLEPIWEVIAAQKPLAYFTLGDNVYIDLPKDQQKQRVYYYRRQFHPSYRMLTSSAGVYAIWDDHDFADNDSAGGPHPFKPSWKKKNFDVFSQNWNNPPYAGGKSHPGTFFDFTIGDVHVIMTDGRYYRDFKKGKTMLGPHQKEWLLQTLGASKSKFKILCSGTLWTEKADKKGKDSWQGVSEERDEIFALIRDQKIPGVFLLAGDRHRHEMFKLQYDVGYPLYEFQTAKVTNIHTHDANKHALFSYNEGNFFGMLDFDFKAADPTVTYRCVTEKGESPKHLIFKTSLSELTP
ncbi:MAG: alkaline phosphatase D family protein [Akkermansiaceae bacterium]